jgi:hypothetical protein
MIVCAEALGPVRFDGWDASGEPVGRPVTYPFIRCLATEEEQSGNTYDNVYVMLSEGEAANEYAVDPGITRTFIKEPGGGEITPSTASSAAKDGGKERSRSPTRRTSTCCPSCTGCTRRCAATPASARPPSRGCSTPRPPTSPARARSPSSPRPSTRSSTRRERLERGVLYDHREAPPLTKDFANDKKLRKALEQVYGPFAERHGPRRAGERHPRPDSRRSRLAPLLAQPAREGRAPLARHRRRVVPARAPRRHDRAGTSSSRSASTARARGTRPRSIGCRVRDGHLFVVRQRDGSAGDLGAPAPAARAKAGRCRATRSTPRCTSQWRA